MAISKQVMVAVSKCFSPDDVKEASQALEAGEYPIDETLRIVGTIKKGQDFYQVQHMRCDTWAILAVALSKLNAVTMESIINEAISAPEEMVEDIKKRVKNVLESYKAEKNEKEPLTTGRVTKDGLRIDLASEFSMSVPPAKKVAKGKQKEQA